MNTLPVDRALSIYETLADRSAVRGTRERLSRHRMKIYLGRSISKVKKTRIG